MASFSFLDPAFGFLLSWPPWLSILLVSIVITFLTTLLYKYTTNQTEIKALRDKQKKFNKEIREVSKKDPKKAMQLQKKGMDITMQLMRHSFNWKSMLYPLIPFLLIFGWFNAHYSYLPLTPNTPFDVTVLFNDGATGTITLSTIPELQLQNATQTIGNNAASWQLQAPEGEYTLKFAYQGKDHTQQILITDKPNYYEPKQLISGEKIKSITVGNMQLKPWSGTFIASIPLIGKANWFWTYVIFVFILSVFIRKLLNVA
ncbi:MAG: EMC3/TMCO1 family protein [archaeon]